MNCGFGARVFFLPFFVVRVVMVDMAVGLAVPLSRQRCFVGCVRRTLSWVLLSRGGARCCGWNLRARVGGVGTNLIALVGAACCLGSAGIVPADVRVTVVVCVCPRDRSCRRCIWALVAWSDVGQFGRLWLSSLLGALLLCCAPTLEPPSLWC